MVIQPAPPPPGVRPGARIWAALGLAAYAVFLVGMAPASLAAPWLERLSHGALVLQDATGTLWRGRGVLRWHGPRAEQVLGDLRWGFNPLRLLLGKASADWQLDGGDLEASLTTDLGMRGVRLKTLVMRADVGWVSGLRPALEWLRLRGRLYLDAPELFLTRAGVEGDAQLTWRQAGVSLSTGTLGNYRVRMTGRGENGGLELTTLSGPLHLTGRGEVEFARGRLRAGGVASADPGEAGRLTPLLNLIGTPLEAGRYRWQFSAPLTRPQG